jgi:hypothetical protein
MWVTRRQTKRSSNDRGRVKKTVVVLGIIGTRLEARKDPIFVDPCTKKKIIIAH